MVRENIRQARCQFPPMTGISVGSASGHFDKHVAIDSRQMPHQIARSEARRPEAVFKFVLRNQNSDSTSPLIHSIDIRQPLFRFHRCIHLALIVDRCSFVPVMPVMLQ